MTGLKQLLGCFVKLVGQEMRAISIAEGYKPNSGSSTRIIDGRKSLGCRKSVAKAFRQFTPSDVFARHPRIQFLAW